MNTQKLEQVSIDKLVPYARNAWTHSKEQIAQFREMRLSAAAQKVDESIEQTLTYMNYPTEHWNRIRTNNTTERANREIKCRTKAIGAFPDG